MKMIIMNSNNENNNDSNENNVKKMIINVNVKMKKIINNIENE